VSYLAHATEDKDRLAAAVERMLKVSAPEVAELEGHHGNKILHIRYHATGEAAAAIFDRIVAGLEPETRKEIATSLQAMTDEHGALYVRLDKQTLFKGKLKIGGRDSLRVRIKPRLFLLKEGAKEFYREAFEKRE
jgi:RNA binding exosome subunit